MKDKLKQNKTVIPAKAHSHEFNEKNGYLDDKNFGLPRLLKLIAFAARNDDNTVAKIKSSLRRSAATAAIQRFYLSLRLRGDDRSWVEKFISTKGKNSCTVGGLIK